MNITKTHEYLEITDTYLNHEVTGGCTFINSNNISVVLTIKDDVNGDLNVSGFISDTEDGVCVSVNHVGSFNASISKYVIDVLQEILNETQVS